MRVVIQHQLIGEPELPCPLKSREVARCSKATDSSMPQHVGRLRNLQPHLIQRAHAVRPYATIPLPQPLTPSPLTLLLDRRLYVGVVLAVDLEPAATVRDYDAVLIVDVDADGPSELCKI